MKDNRKTWAERETERLEAKDRPEWSEDDVLIDRYIQGVYSEMDYWDSLD